jgi:phage internal scaffolding protein
MEVSMSSVKAHALKSVRAAYDFDTQDFDPGIDCTGYVGDHGEWFETPSMTRQADAEDCDINVMMARYQATGVEPRTNPRAAQWGDFSSVLGFQDALNVVRQSEADFAALPAAVRDRFGNDPAQMLAFLERSENRAEAERLGLVIPPKPEDPPMRVEVVNEGRGETSPPKGSKDPAPAA